MDKYNMDKKIIKVQKDVVLNYKTYYKKQVKFNKIFNTILV